MPEQTASNDILKALDFLEDYTLTTNLSRCHNYQTIQTALDTGCDITDVEIQRVLAVCMHDLKEDMKYAVNTLNIITIILKAKIKKNTSIDLVPSALAIMNIIKTSAVISNVQALQTLSFDILLLYPDEVYIKIVTDHGSEIEEILSLYFDERNPVTMRLMPFALLLKMLKTLPSDLVSSYIKDNVDMWFSLIIPTVMFCIPNQSNKMSKALDVLDILTDNLESVEYSENPHWKNLLECIYVPQRYPAIMTSLLKTGNDSWCRLWIVFVKLLKQQITMYKSKLGSPINSMLPVVEMAFKMDVTNRCRAFQCWGVLTDNFAMEQNESFISKRLKLLIIPLKSNNAKVEETALAKFNCWWQLIRKFETKKKFFELIYIPFLHFCFGNCKGNKNTVMIVPGQLSLELKKNCVEALVESIGHVDCDSCVSLLFPRLEESFLNPTLLVNYLSEWLNALQAAIKISSENFDSTNATKQIQCIWKSLLENCSKIQDENINNTLNEILNLIFQVVQESINQERVLDIVFNTLLPVFFTHNNVKCLLKVKNDPKDCMGSCKLIWYKIFTLILKPPFYNFYPSNDTAASVAKIQPMTNALVDKECFSNDSVEWLLNELPTHDNGLILWTALTKSVIESDCNANVEVLEKVILWPLKNQQCFKNLQFPASVWNNSYNTLKHKLTESSIDKEISKILEQNSKASTSSLLSLFAFLQIFNENSSHCNAQTEMLVKLLVKFKDYKSAKMLLPKLVEVLVMLLKKVIDTKDGSLAEFTLTAVNYACKLILESSKKTEDRYDKQVEILLKSVNKLFKNDEFVKFKSVVLEQIIACGTTCQQQPARDVICKLLKTILDKSKETEVPLYTMVRTAIVTLEKHNIPESKNENKFISPKVATAKKPKKKEPSIVNTVVENGEEFVVVKSNWKFNPKKLTENQKEKFQRKSDIPALYQDLSQSQDEFKMTPWKTDSQDASTTNNSSSNSKSASKTNDEIYSVLKKMPSTDVVPNIIGNILFEGSKTESDNDKSKFDKIGVENVDTSKTTKMISLSSPKHSKSPRVALKDRVYQNVKNLIEKSTTSPQRKTTSTETNETVQMPGLTTPKSKDIIDINTTNSAPSRIVTDRPSRLKRKPKKYELHYQEVPLIKKSRNSVVLSDSQKDPDSDQLDDNPQSLEQQQDLVNDTYNKLEPNITETKEKEIDANTLDQGIKNIDPDNANCDVIIIDDDLIIVNDKTKSPEKSCTGKNEEETQNSETICDTNLSQDVNTTSVGNKETDKVKSSKKATTKKSRIEKELAIDMVEGHPFLQSADKRATRKSNVGSVISTRRKALTEKLNNLSQSDSKVERNLRKQDCLKYKPKSDIVKELFAAKDSNENTSTSTDDMPMSEDFIESSQDSTLTTVSVKSNKSIRKKNQVIALSSIQGLIKSNKKVMNTQSLLDNSSNSSLNTTKTVEEDIEFSQNKTICQENDVTDLTEDMDTEPMENKSIPVADNITDVTAEQDTEPMENKIIPIENNCTNLTAEIDTEPMENKDNLISDEVILITDDADPVEVITDDAYQLDSQCTANADTQPMDPNHFEECAQVEEITCEPGNKITIKDTPLKDPTSKMLKETAENETEDGLSSFYKDEAQRNKEFLNSTLEISPIKVMSPIPDEKQSTMTEESNDYVVIKLASPVQCNGEPFDKSESPGSPEIFTEDKLSPDKRDLSPPRIEVPGNISSPSSLSLKKNKPQMRSGGRAAQMLGLCVPDSLQNLKNNEKANDSEEPKKPFSTSARRNLRILNNCGENKDNDGDETGENSESFLKFKRALPSSDSSPSVPILKRKLVDIADEATVSPASKRKRVSFHDPPVSTTISVQKYIEPLGTKSPQNSMQKKLERLNRVQTDIKSLKRLVNVFKQDTAQVITISDETFDDVTPLTNDDTMSSLEPTPAVEVVNTTDLNDKDPICPELVDCINPISDIAAELSSPAMQELLVKELEENIKTVGDLARLTELEINRLCIKAPKVKVAKKVLSDYADIQMKLITCNDEKMIVIDAVEPAEVSNLQESPKLVCRDQDIQTDSAEIASVQTQTTKSLHISRLIQTDQSGNMSTEAVIKSCLSERQDYVVELCKQLQDDTKIKITETLPLNTVQEIVSRKISDTVAAANVLDSVIRKHNEFDTTNNTGNKSLTFIKDYICDRYSTSDLILFCSDLLKNVHDKST